MKKIAVLTSGGDCSGMNAAIKGVAVEAFMNNVEVVAILEGYKGLVNGNCKKIDFKVIEDAVQKGGTFLMTSRYPRFKEEHVFKKALNVIAKNGIEGLVVIGGNGSMRGAEKLYKAGVPVVGIPASIDNDIYGTDIALGVDTALNVIIQALDIIRYTASSHGRVFVVETMGRKCGYLAATTALASGADAVLIPEAKFDVDSIIERLGKEHRGDRIYSIIVVSEGTRATGEMLGKLRDAEFDTRMTVLGHIQRGGSPTAFDRLLAFRFAVKATESLLKGKYGCMVGLNRSKTTCTSIENVVTHKRGIKDKKLLQFVKKKSR
ncbi:MAG: 6-phosphofructokinase [Campylobacterota bacterium]|nr:6-phosphofructokinase [Campylobacterota bacterium]